MGGFAWVTLATNDSYSLGALVLAHSLRRVNTSHQLAVLITPAVSQSMKEQLQAVFDVVKVVDVLDSKDETNLALLKRPELGITFTKIHCWTLTQFEKCVFLDADTLVVRNCDELFEREELSAAPDVGWPDCFNTGVFVYKPSVETFNNLVQLAVDQGSFDGGDQGLLNQYFSDWATSDIKKHLPFVYNLTSVAVYSYIPAFKHYGSQIRIVHFIGAIKPWLQELDPATRTISSAPGAEHLTPLLQNWWDIFCEKVHPALAKDLECASGMLNLQVPACSNAIETSDQSGIPDNVQPFTPYIEKDDSRQINLPYTPFEVTSSSGESLTAQFLEIREQEILEKQRREQEWWEQEQKRIQEEKEREKEEEIVKESDDKHDDEPPEEPQPEMQESEEQNEGYTEPEHHEQPHQSHFDYYTFYPDESCINTYLDQNTAFYQPFDSQNKSFEPLPVYNENPFSYTEPEQQAPSLPRFLTIPEDDQRQTFNVVHQEWHPPPPQQEEHQHQQWHYVPPEIPPPCYQSTSHENLHEAVQDLQKSKSMTNLSDESTNVMSGNFWKSQPNVNVDSNKKFAMPKLKPLLPKQVSSPQPPTPVYEARPKITQYTEFHMSSEYKDPVKLPSDNIGFVERQILKEKRTKSSKVGSKFGALPYIEPMEPYVPEPSPPKQKTPLKEIDCNEVVDYDLSLCIRQSGNKPLPKDSEKKKQKKENALIFLPDLKPLVPADDRREQFKKRKSDERLQVPEDGRRKKKEKRDSRKARERKRKEEMNKKPVEAEVYKHTTDVQEILKRLVNYTKDYQDYFKEPEEKVSRRKSPSPTILINGKELESQFSPIEVYPSFVENGFDRFVNDFMKPSSELSIEEEVKRIRDEEKVKKTKTKKSKKVVEEIVGKIKVPEQESIATLERKEEVEKTEKLLPLSLVESEVTGKPEKDAEESKVQDRTSELEPERMADEPKNLEEALEKDAGDSSVQDSGSKLGTTEEPDSLVEQIIEETNDVTESEIQQYEGVEEKVPEEENVDESAIHDAALEIEKSTLKDSIADKSEARETPTVEPELSDFVSSIIDKVEVVERENVKEIMTVEEGSIEQPLEQIGISSFQLSEVVEEKGSSPEELFSEETVSPCLEVTESFLETVGVENEELEASFNIAHMMESEEQEKIATIAPEQLEPESIVERIEQPISSSEVNEIKESTELVDLESALSEVLQESENGVENQKIDAPTTPNDQILSVEVSLPKLQEDDTDEDNSFLDIAKQSDEDESPERITEHSPKPRSKPEEPFRHFRTFIKEQNETSQKGLLGIQEIIPTLPAKTFASGIVISHAITATDKQVPQPETIPLEEPTLIEEPQVQVQIPEQNQDSDSGVSTDGTEHTDKNKSPQFELSPEIKEPVPEEPDKSWSSWADESSEITKSVAEMVLSEPEEPLTETLKPLTYAVVAQKNAPSPSLASSPRKSLFSIPSAQKTQKHSSKKSSQSRKPKPSQEKVEPVDVVPKTKSSPKKVEKAPEEVKKPSNIFEVLPEESLDESPDESVESSMTKKIAKSKKAPKSSASKTKLVPSANFPASRVNIAAEDVPRDESETRLADPNDNTGIAGAIANLSLESGSEIETSGAASSAQEEYLRRQNWETGRIDYLGRDSFDNIWTKICETLDKKETESPDEETNNETPNLVSTASIQLAQPEEEPVQITEYDSRGPVSLSMILNDQPSEVEYIETLPSDNIESTVTDDDDIIFLKSADRHLYLSNIEEESPEEVKESSQELPQSDGKASEGGGSIPERLDVLCTGIIESKKESAADAEDAKVGSDFVVVEKEAVLRDQEATTGPIDAVNTKPEEEKAGEVNVESQELKEEVKLGAELPLKETLQEAKVEENLPEIGGTLPAQTQAEEVSEPQIVLKDQKEQDVQSVKAPEPEKKEAAEVKAPEVQLQEEKKIEGVSETPAAAEPEKVQEVQKVEVDLINSVPEPQLSEKDSKITVVPETVVVETVATLEETLPEPQPETELKEPSAPVPQEASKEINISETTTSPIVDTEESGKEQKAEAVQDVQKLEEPVESPCESAPEKEQNVEAVSVVQVASAPVVEPEVQKIQESTEATSSPAQEPQVQIPETSAVPEPEVKEKESVTTAPESQTSVPEQKSETATQEPELVQEIKKPEVLEAKTSQVPEITEEERKPESVIQETVSEVPTASEPENVQEVQKVEVDLSSSVPEPQLSEKESKVPETGPTVEEKLPEPQAPSEEQKVEALVPEIQPAAEEPVASQEGKALSQENNELQTAKPQEAAKEPEQAKSDSKTDVEEKKKAENLDTTLSEKKLEINPNPGPSSHNPGNPESHNPGNPSKTNNPGNGKNGKEKKGVISKILEFVGVAPKQKKSRDESGEASKSVFYDSEIEKPSETQSEAEKKPSEAQPEPEKLENPVEEPARKSPIPHVPPTLIETSFVSASIPSEDIPVPQSTETIDEILKATDLSSISEDVPIVQSQQEDPTGEEVVRELIQIAEEASAKLAAEESSETIESITGKLILLTDGLKELVQPAEDVKEEAGLSEEDTLEISKVVAETFEKIISVLEDPAAYIEEEKKRSPSPRIAIKEIVPDTSIISPTPPTSPEDIPKPKKDAKLLLVDETIPETPPVVEKDSDSEKKTPIFLESNLIVDNQFIDTESLLSDINDIIEEAKTCVESQFSLECSCGEVNGEEKFEGLKVEGSANKEMEQEGGESEKATKEKSQSEVKTEDAKSEESEVQVRKEETKVDEEIAPISSESNISEGAIGVAQPAESIEDQTVVIKLETEKISEILKTEQDIIEEVCPVESEIQTENEKNVDDSGKSEPETIKEIPPVEPDLEKTSKELPVIKSEPQTEDEFEEAVEELPEENVIISGTLVIDALGRTRDKTPEETPKIPEKIERPQIEETIEAEEPVYSNVQKIDSKLVITTPPPPPPPPETKPFEVEEIKVTSEEERKKHKSQPSTSKLSGQILKAIPPPRRKAISEARGRSTGAIPKTKSDDPKVISVVLEQPISETMSVERNLTPPPVPPRRNRSKQRQPPLPPPKRKTKK